MKTLKKLFSAVLVLSFLFMLTVPALAWDLRDGDITISMESEGQYVSQNGGGSYDANPTITSEGEETVHVITVTGTTGDTFRFVVEDLVINTGNTNTAIDIADGTDVTITVVGENSISNTEQKTSSSTTANATIHVADATLTITGAETGENSLEVNCNETEVYRAAAGAGIGSDREENFEGTINITGNVNVHSENMDYGAGIGSGKTGDFNGEVNITDGANVIADSCWNAAAIGAGQSGDFNGTVNIDNATVEVDSYDNGAGIGGGYKGDFTGEVNITNGSDVYANAGNDGSSRRGEAAGIGAGYDGDFSGSVTISDSTVFAESNNDGAGIGSGGVNNPDSEHTEFTGTIVIQNSDVTVKNDDTGTPLGASESSGVFNGTIEITGDTNLTLVDGKNTSVGQEVLIGGVNGDSGQVTIEDTVNVEAWVGERDGWSLDNGELVEIPPEDFDLIINAAVVTIVEVPRSSVGQSSSGGYTIDEGTIFWRDVDDRIHAAEKGTKLTVDAGRHDLMPTYILDSVEECEVTLVIRWDGGEDITVEPDHGLEYNNVRRIYLKTLAEMLEELDK